MQADEADIGRLAAGGLINRVAVINRRDELRADLVDELVLFDVGARDRELFERRVFLLELDRGEFSQSRKSSSVDFCASAAGAAQSTHTAAAREIFTPTAARPWPFPRSSRSCSSSDA